MQPKTISAAMSTAQMMPQMMSHCLGMVLPNMTKEKRTDVALKMVATLVEPRCVGMSEKEKKDFFAGVAEKAKA